MVNRNGIPILSDEEIEKAFRDREEYENREIKGGTGHDHIKAQKSISQGQSDISAP